MTSQAIAHAPVIQKRSPWGGWWLILITLGIYYFVWYHKINAELAVTTGKPQNGWAQWWSQIIPIYGLVGLHHTAKRLGEAIQSHGSGDRVSPAIAWFWAPIWFGSQQRYLQRRMNLLGSLAASRATA